jgi:hypothetical protein
MEATTTAVLVYIGNSRWTSTGHNHALHIADEKRQPICGKKYKNGALDVYNGSLDEITCAECLKTIKK